MMHYWMDRWRGQALAAALLLILCLSVPFPASAHERHPIVNGQAEVVVGWLNEPAYADQPNAVSITGANPTTKEPIEGLEKTIKVEVIKGAAKRAFDLQARFGQKGAYVANIVPTSSGDYSFRFTGEINGVKIDEKFESGPGRFNAIQPLSGVQFPAPQPTAGELQGQLTEARALADGARTLALGGLVVGVVGLLVAGGALALRGRARGPAMAVGTTGSDPGPNV